MPEIEVDTKTYEKILFSARLLNQTPSHVVSMLVERVSAPAITGADVRGTESELQKLGRLQEPNDEEKATMVNQWLPVHKTFKGHTVKARFRASTMEVEILSSPWSGRLFSSPTAAAQAVVEEFSLERATPNTNGRKFWKLDSSGDDLRSVIGARF